MDSRSVASPLTDGAKTGRQPFRPSHILTGLGSPAASSLFRGGAFQQNTRIAEVSTMWKRDEAVKPSGPAAPAGAHGNGPGGTPAVRRAACCHTRHGQHR